MLGEYVYVDGQIVPKDKAVVSVFDHPEIKPIVSIGGRPVGSGRPGPMTRQLHEALRALMDSKVASESF